MGAPLHQTGTEGCQESCFLGVKPKAQELIEILRNDPFANPPPYEKLVGDLSGAYSRRINIQHRLVYQVLEKERAVKVLRLWTHYE